MKLLSTAIGDFWMSADKIVLPFKAVDVTNIINKRYTYSVDQSIILIPELPEHFSYSDLGFPSYFDIDDRYRGQLLFQVTYKSLDEYQLLDKQGIDDLSIDFSFEEMSLWINSRK
ncbi:hypothetical protein ACLUWI_09575 [Limosilactobacillus mucosae]|uniref:hypothetical protein n=1 Tax=Limosilactobacillus mucosae TaxID=97478 RepID=UPI0039969CB2